MSQSIETQSITASLWMNTNARMSMAPNVEAGGDRFANLLRAQAQPDPVKTPTAREASVTVRAGDTLIGIVQRQASSQGVSLSPSQAYAEALNLAKANGIDNPNLIHPGQRLNLTPVLAGRAGGAERTAAAPATTPATPAAPSTQSLLGQRTVATTPQRSVMRPDLPTTPILSRTLDRAIAKGFMPQSDRQAVYDKIMTMSKTFGFAPDDFARMTLMESDGMNPKASNSRCHGIIQFCDGPDRGAASAGFAQNPRAILNQSVLEQLDLVSKYFEDTGLRSGGKVTLDDLYLTVLTPSARNESRPTAKLNIAGTQSEYLHMNSDRRLPITRQSIVQGLHQNTHERLGLEPGNYFRLVNQSNPMSHAQRKGANVWLASSGKTSP